MIVAFLTLVSIGRSDEISPAGKHLAEKLDAMDVEHHWEPGRSVAWKTGKLLEKQGEFRKSNTHCSAFVAATCLRMEIYILRPPEHETKNLANAQAEWLAAKGAESGWKPVQNSVDAQHLANKGHLVVAVFKEMNPEKNGHIAIVRPSTKSFDQIQFEGPQVIQAGTTNANSTSLKEGFKHHPGAFPNGVKYYTNAR
jgi:hypothetical protein